MKYRNLAICAAAVAIAVSVTTAGAPARADQDDHGRNYQQQPANTGTWNNGRWYPNGYNNAPNQNQGRRDRDDRIRYNNSQYQGQYNGSPYYGQPRYTGNPYYNRVPYNPTPNYNGSPYYGTPYYNGGNSGYVQGNATLQGVIIGVNGDQLTVRDDSGRAVYVNDQPALANQSSGRVYVGRSVHAYGYWQGNVFYATQMN